MLSLPYSYYLFNIYILNLRCKVTNFLAPTPRILPIIFLKLAKLVSSAPPTITYHAYLQSRLINCNECFLHCVLFSPSLRTASPNGTDCEFAHYGLQISISRKRHFWQLPSLRQHPIVYCWIVRARLSFIPLEARSSTSLHPTCIASR